VSTPRFALIKLQYDISRAQVSIGDVQLITEDLFQGSAAVFRIQSFADYFFVVMNMQTYRIDQAGNIELVVTKPLQILNNRGALAAIAPNQNSGNVEYLTSDDLGKTWTVVGEFPVPEMAGFQYTIIGGELIGYDRSQIFHVKLSDTTYEIEELQNHGLAGGEISSISMPDDETVLITTMCNSFTTDCGGYIKPLADFFDPQED
jgi:hypothetical protein